MAEKITEIKDYIKPVVLRVPSTDDEFTLDFNRDSVVYAEEHGFIVDEISSKPVSGIQKLFWYSFRKNHRRVTEEQAKSIMDELGGIPEAVVTRLIKLYGQAAYVNLVNDDESKNPEGTWRL